MMSAIRTKHTDPEIVVRRALFAQGFRYRLNVRNLPGSPDVVLPRHRAAILVHGCFWHRHVGCRFYRLPKTRPEFWENKLSTNALRDERDAAALLSMGWRVAVVWECATRSPSSRLAEKLASFVRGGDSYVEITE
jgi:DNA mismatch endonuclease (patch repair protein)